MLNKLDGKILGIGLNEKEVKALKNKDTYFYSSYSEEASEGRVKQIHIKKLRKRHKKNKPDYFICDFNQVTLKSRILYDSLFLTKKKIIVRNLDDSLIRRYQRFGTIKKEGQYYVIVKTKKINRFKEIFSNMLDTIIDGLNLVSDLLS